MGKKMVSIIAGALMICASASAASAFLMDWKINPNGTGAGSATTVEEYLDTIGNSFIKNNISTGGAFTFNDWGFFKAVGHDGNGTAFSPEITGTFSGSGSGVLGGAINFNPGGVLNIYADAANNYATNTASPVFYGANDGTLIGTFTITNGFGAVFPTGVPNGEITLSLLATYLKPGYWFDSANTDLASVPGWYTVLGFATTNASTLTSVNSTLKNALEGFSGVSPVGTSLPTDIAVSNNGQYRLDAVVPEPSTFALLGLGLAGLGIGAFRRKSSK